MGVENIWVIQPLQHLVYSASEAGYRRLPEILTIEGTPARIDMADLFAQLDELLAGRL
jgi:hypothetical protein